MAGPTPEAPIALRDCGPGRPLWVEPSGRLWAARGDRIVVSDDAGASFRSVARVPFAAKRRAGRLHRLLARLLRFEVRSLLPLPGGSLIASTRDGVYCCGTEGGTMRPSRIEAGDQPCVAPFDLVPGPDGVCLFGEYDAQTGHGKPVRIYASRDGGQSFGVAHVLEAGSVMHVHTLRFDPARRHYWVFAGDYGQEPGIGMLSEDLSRFEWFQKGAQRFRVCAAFDLGDRLVYATDSNVEPNAIVSLHKESGATSVLADIEGSSLFGCRFGGTYAITTAVEPGGGTDPEQLSLWTSPDGERWSRAFAARKDAWPAVLQFGVLVLPRGGSDHDTLYVGGQATRELEGRLAAGRPLER